MTTNRTLRSLLALVAVVGGLALVGTASADRIIPHPPAGSQQAKADGCLALQLGFQQDQQDLKNNPAGSKAAVAAGSDAADVLTAAAHGGCAWAQ